ncbi:MAG: type II secretion system minor pseudopilin GspK [Rudaea sp.]
MSGVRSSQRGVALIVALLVVALATILIAALLDRGSLIAARTRNGLRDTQAQDYAVGLESYAAHVLSQDFEQDPDTDSADDIWAIPLPPTPVPGGEINATMTDLDGRFNLNNLSPDSASSPNPQQGNWRDAFGLLLDALKLDPALAGNIENWMNNGSAANTDDAWYAAQYVPYRSGKRIFSHVSELRLVKGFDGDTYARILPHVSALPVGTTININTATVPVLMTFLPGYSEQEATGVWQQGHAHYAAGEINTASSGGQSLLPRIRYPSLYGVQSHYFLARGDITLDGLPFTFYSLIERRLGSGNGADAGIHVLQRSRGGD